MALGPETVYLQAREIERVLISRRVKKIEAGDSWIALFFMKDDALFFSWDAEWYGACSADAGEIRELSAAASSRPPIADALKSHLLGAELVSASAPGRDRIIMLEFERAVGAGVKNVRRLALEASGRYSNAVLIGDDGRTLEAAKHILPDVNRYRTTAPGAIYTMPPTAGDVSLDDLDLRVGIADASLLHVTGIGPTLSKALISCGADLAGLELFRGEAQGAVYQMIGSYLTAYSTCLDGAHALASSSALEAARHVSCMPIGRRYADSVRRRIANSLSKEEDRVVRKIHEAEAAIAGTNRAEEMMREGRLILANAHAIPRRASSADLTSWGEDGEAAVRVSLDPSLDAAANAQKRFAKYKKMIAARERAEATMPALLAEREVLSEQYALLDCHTSITTLLAMLPESSRRPIASKKASVLPPHGRRDDEALGCSFYWGLSARGNHYVTFRLARPDDLWFHAQGIPGAHVILRFTAEPTEEAFDAAVASAASCASLFSRAKGERIPVDFAPRRYVRAIPGGGGARVTYRDFSTISIDGERWSNICDAHQ